MAYKLKYFSFQPLLVKTGRFGLLHFLVALTILYLFWQVSLSAAIISADSPEKTQTLSRLARNTMGFGMFLFVFRTCCGKFFPASPIAQSIKQRLFWPLLFVSIMAGWGAMIAEDAIVNHYADKTTGQDRVDAKLILFFNQAFDAGNVTLPDLTQSIAESRIGSGTFAKMLGFAIWTNPALIAQIRVQAGAILTSIHARKWYDQIDASYDAYIENLKKFAGQLSKFEALERRNFMNDSSQLNRQLVKFAQCADKKCRQKVNDQTNRYLQNEMNGLQIDLMDFCRKISVSRYVMGRELPDGERLECHVSEKSLHDWLMGKKKAFIREAFAKSGLPQDMLTDINPIKPLTREAWRKRFLADMGQEIAKMEKQEFGTPEDYGPGGKDAVMGRDYAIAIFLPPIALGFSVTVCFLHLASLAAKFTRRSITCYGTAFVVWLIPAFLAASMPISGFWGIYGRWLVFWEETIAPFGIFRWMLG